MIKPKKKLIKNQWRDWKKNINKDKKMKRPKKVDQIKLEKVSNRKVPEPLRLLNGWWMRQNKHSLQKAIRKKNS